MRPLWRNTLWFAFAAVCGGVGYWQGIGKGAEIIASMAASNEADEAFSDISRALDVLDRAPGNAYAESNLRSALFKLGASEKALSGWWTCRERNPALLARAAAYVAAHPTKTVPVYDGFVSSGLRICESAKRKSK